MRAGISQAARVTTSVRSLGATPSGCPDATSRSVAHAVARPNHEFRGALMTDEILHQETAATIKRLTAKHKDLSKEMRKAHGYVVFPSLGRAGLVLGASYGKGEAFENGRSIG